MERPLTKAQVQDELKGLIEVAEKTLESEALLTFQVSITTVSNGRKVKKETVLKALKAIQAFHSQAAEEWLFEPAIMVRSTDIAGASMQEELVSRQKAKASLVASTSKLKDLASSAKG